jgi:hypothetical protein
VALRGNLPAALPIGIPAGVTAESPGGPRTCSFPSASRADRRGVGLEHLDMIEQRIEKVLQ